MNPIKTSARRRFTLGAIASAAVLGSGLMSSTAALAQALSSAVASRVIGKTSSTASLGTASPPRSTIAIWR